MKWGHHGQVLSKKELSKFRDTELSLCFAERPSNSFVPYLRDHIYVRPYICAHTAFSLRCILYVPSSVPFLP
jgi:hypothetical protein